MADVIIYTDGGCSGNPGPGGWAFLMRHHASGKELEKSGGEETTTNNRMELCGVIEALKSLIRPTEVDLYTDSVYVGKGMTQWMKNWKKNGWKRKDGKKLVPVKNDDLWKQLDELIQVHQVNYFRVAGHSGDKDNDRVDQLAVAAYQKYL